jgi:hypothetical protein
VVRVIAEVLAGIGAAFITCIGIMYLAAPEKMAPSFGLPSWPADSERGWFGIKGVRDVASGLMIFVAIAVAPAHVLGWLLFAGAVTPFGDAALVLRNGGSKSAAYGMHGATALAVIAIGIVLLFV